MWYSVEGAFEFGSTVMLLLSVLSLYGGPDVRMGLHALFAVHRVIMLTLAGLP